MDTNLLGMGAPGVCDPAPAGMDLPLPSSAWVGSVLPAARERKKRKISGGFLFIFLIPALKISGLKTFNTGYCMCCPVVPCA